MGQQISINRINFEDMQIAIKNNNYLIISTLPVSNQNCLIMQTISPDEEIQLLNNSATVKKIIIIYGKNSSDISTSEKYKQLVHLGFANTYIYMGGLFEWLLLQDIYGGEEFPTTSAIKDILKYKGNRILNLPLLEY